MNHARLQAPERLDASHADELERQFDESIRAGCYQLELSLAGTVFLSSAGIRSLMIGYRKLGKLGGSLRLTDVNDQIRGVILMSGLEALLAAGAPPRAAGQTPSATHRTTLNGILFTIEGETKNTTPARPVLIGNARALEAGDSTLHEWRIGPDMCGVGLGAFGARDASTSLRVGEWMAACGVALTLPPDSQSTDYMVASGDYAPHNQLRQALCFPGNFNHAARFSPANGQEDIPLADLLDAALQLAGAPAIGLLIAGEISGLVGATLAAAPAGGSHEEFFAYPGLRERLAFTPEPEHGGDLALVVGVAARNPATNGLDGFLRTTDAARGLRTHLHAAVFPYCAMPSGRVEPAAFVRRLVEHERVRALLHLLNDTRAETGAGDSRLRSGLLWTCPLEDTP